MRTLSTLHFPVNTKFCFFVKCELYFHPVLLIYSFVNVGYADRDPWLDRSKTSLKSEFREHYSYIIAYVWWLQVKTSKAVKYFEDIRDWS